VPPQIVTATQAQEYAKLSAESWNRIGEGDFAGADEIIGQQESIGHFGACFVHDPDEPLIAIYPTIPSDIAHTIQIYRNCRSFITRG
jgi:hypothetical protein